MGVYPIEHVTAPYPHQPPPPLRNLMHLFYNHKQPDFPVQSTLTLANGTLVEESFLTIFFSFFLIIAEGF